MIDDKIRQGVITQKIFFFLNTVLAEAIKIRNFRRKNSLLYTIK